MNQRTAKQAVTKYGAFTLKAMSFHVLLITGIIAQIVALWLSGQENLFPDSDAISQLVGTSAEIIAGLYGITMAGYTFFLSRMDSLTATDVTLDYIVASLKNRFKYLIWYITGTVATALGMSVVIMYYPEANTLVHPYFYRLICNEFLLFLAFAVGLILYYSICVIDPGCLEKEAAKLKRRLSPRPSLPGNPAEYIMLYDQIETLCNSMIPSAVLQQIHDNKGNRFEYTIELLDELYPALRSTLKDVRRIHRYYECSVNCSSITVSLDMCNLAKEVLQKLNEVKLPTP